MFQLRWVFCFSALALCFSACALDDELIPDPAAGSGEVEIPSFEDYFDSKVDTGYIGNRAFEIEATFAGRVRVQVPDKTDEELMTIAEALLADSRNWQYRDITAQVTEQIKYARNTLQQESLNLNLEGGNPTFSSIEVIDGALELNYTIRIESLVKYKDLESKGLTVDDLVGRTIELQLPLVPEGLFERVGATCAWDPDTNAEIDPHELGAHNLFYYFSPTREGCTLAEADLTTGTYHVESSLDAATVYPEYDLLVADGRIDMAIIFGQIKHGELENTDWGFLSFNGLTREFQQRGFQIVETYDDNRGHRLEATYPGDLVIDIEMWTPVGFADNVPREEANERFRTALRNHEIVYYNGHAFYGSLRVLDDPEAYPQDTYQVLMMDSCWSYAYYTKQIFRNRATEEDPNGYALVDVVNNTEPGISGSYATAAILWTSIFRGASMVRVGTDASLYSWNNINAYMNEHAEYRARARTQYPNPEIYGVSGVRNNNWAPAAVDPNPDVDPDPDRSRYTNDTAVPIPDNDPVGATSNIHVPEGTGRLEAVTIRANIEHTYIGDLKVVVTHDGRILTIHEGSGGNTVNLTIELETDHYSGANAEGIWILHAVDSGTWDEGQIVSWSIEF